MWPSRSPRDSRQQRLQRARVPAQRHLCGPLTPTCARKGVTVPSYVPLSPIVSTGTNGRRRGSFRRCSRRAPARETRSSAGPSRMPRSPTCGAPRRVRASSRPRARCADGSRTTSRVHTPRANSSSAAAACVTSSLRSSCSSSFTAERTLSYACARRWRRSRRCGTAAISLAVMLISSHRAIASCAPSSTEPSCLVCAAPT